VRDVIAYVKLLVQPDDELAFARAAGAPPRGIGAKSLERVLAHAAARRIPLAQAFEEAAGLEGGAVEGVGAAAAEAGRDFCRLLATLREPSGLTLVARIERLLEAVGYRAEVERLYPDPLERTRRWAAVEELLQLARTFGGRKKGDSLADFLRALTLEEEDEGETDDDAERKRVTLMTLHSAKGLEFPRVYLVGLEEGLLPHRRSVAEGNVEEERRLMYVGITRARSTLVVSTLARRKRGRETVAGMPSRFIAEMKLAEAEGPRADPRAQLKALRDAAARRAEAAKARAGDGDPPLRTA